MWGEEEMNHRVQALKTVGAGWVLQCRLSRGWKLGFLSLFCPWGFVPCPSSLLLEPRKYWVDWNLKMALFPNF